MCRNNLEEGEMMFHRTIVVTFVFLLLFSFGTFTDAQAAEGGYSNYVPGTYGDFAAAVAPTEKITIRNDFYYYQADGGASVRSGFLETNADIEAAGALFTLLHKPDVGILGAQFAYGVLIPIPYIDIDAKLQVRNQQVQRQDDVFSLGDIILVPAILFWNKGNFHFSLAEYIVTPTGEYDKDNLANAGLNYWTFDTDFAVTYLNEKTGQDYSINFGYNYNTENEATDYKTGQEIHIDYMINQFFSESFAVGVHGFYLKQITGDSGAGASLGDFKAEAAGIGPAVLWSTKILNTDVAFITKWLHEYDAEKRFEGDHVFISFAFSF
jgi:hypothetical protein